MTEILIKFRTLKKWLAGQAGATWCGVVGHRWDVLPLTVRCTRCGKPGW